MRNNIIMRDGSTEMQERANIATAGAKRRADYIDVNAGETLGSITLRAYGANTPELRSRITSANESLSGRIEVPR